ncbi:hypothetical protein D3C76_1590100 [compost metagenome]
MKAAKAVTIAKAVIIVTTAKVVNAAKVVTITAATVARSRSRTRKIVKFASRSAKRLIKADSVMSSSHAASATVVVMMTSARRSRKLKR